MRSELNKAYGRSAGFTLIELMIAITILSMLLLTASYSYSLIATRWDKVLNGYNDAKIEARNLTLLINMLDGIQASVVRDQERGATLLFVGNEESLFSYTRSGVFDNQYGEIFRLSVVEDENGLKSLVYQALSARDLVLKYSQQEVEFTDEITLLSGLADIKFKYVGWTNSDDKNPNTYKPPEILTRYSGIDYQMMPSQLELNLVKGERLLSLPISFEERAELRLSAYNAGEVE